MKRTGIFLPEKLLRKIKNNKLGLSQSEFIRHILIEYFKAEEKASINSEHAILGDQIERIMEKISALNMKESAIPDEPLLSILRSHPSPLFELASALDLEPKKLFLKLDQLKKEGKVNVSKNMRWYCEK